nr:hypothetical protein [Paraburkholderia oxyphila]
MLLAGTLDKVYDGYLMSVHPETGELLFSDAIDEAERARLAGDHTRLRKTPTAEQALYLGAHYQRFLAEKAERSSKPRN